MEGSNYPARFLKDKELTVRVSGRDRMDEEVGVVAVYPAIFISCWSEEWGRGDLTSFGSVWYNMRHQAPKWGVTTKKGTKEWKTNLLCAS